MIKRQLSTKPSYVKCQKDVSLCIFAKIKYIGTQKLQKQLHSFSASWFGIINIRVEEKKVIHHNIISYGCYRLIIPEQADGFKAGIYLALKRKLRLTCRITALYCIIPRKLAVPLVQDSNVTCKYIFLPFFLVC